MIWDANKTYALLLFPLVVGIGIFFFLKQEKTVPETVVRIGDREWRTETVFTPESRAKGLSDRDTLCPDCAMLFRFGAEGTHGFWMKDMRFPIDIAWIRDGRIVHVERHVPADFKGVMTPPIPADTVLETNAGNLDDITTGAEVVVQENL
ncbi:MAG: DUF192 domain-containing protein [Candidatus Moranbacteria bacterium]|nr:DUF192 domain-containing protein [Candidatus Moranbacteria bacterium]